MRRQGPAEALVKQCDVSTCKLEVFERLPFPSTSWECITYDAIKGLHGEQGKKSHQHSYSLKDICNFIANHSLSPEHGANVEEEVSAVLSTQTYLFQAVPRTRGQALWTLQPASLQKSAFALSDASNTRVRRRRTPDVKLEPVVDETPRASRKRRRPSEPPIEAKVIVAPLTPIKHEVIDDVEEEEIDIDGDFVDLFSGAEVNEALAATLDAGSDVEDSASLSDIDVLYFGDDDDNEDDSVDDDEYLERPMKRPRLDTPSPCPQRQGRRSRIIHEMTLEDLEEIEKSRRKNRKTKQRLKKDTQVKESKPTTEEEAPPPRVAISLRRVVPIIDQYDDDFSEAVMYIEADPSEEVHPSDDEFNDDPILLEIVPEWQWPGVEHHPFFLHDKKGSGSKDEMSGQSSSGHVSETNDKSDSKSDDEIDILGGSSSDSEDDALPLKRPLVSDSEEEYVFSPDEQPALSDVANQTLFIPTWRIIDIDGDRIELISIDPSSNDDELPESAYKRMHRRRELIEKMELREFLKARKKRARGKKV